MAWLEIPHPLVTAPGRTIWEKYSGQEYIVFIDESFFHFFDFSYSDGSFCHGTFGIPAEQYVSFQSQFAATVEELLRVLSPVLGRKARELKNADIYKLPFNQRRKFALKLNRAILSHGGFVAGFYTSNRGIVMEQIRVALLDENLSVPSDHKLLYDRAVAKLNSMKTAPGSGDLISNLIRVPISAVTHFLSAFGCSFRMVYDPRQPQEDQHVRSMAEEYMRLLATKEIADMLKLDGVGMGVDVSRRSEDEVGLQIADFVAGEVRRFFRFNAELLRWGSDLTLVSSESDDELESAIQIQGKFLKDGRFVRTPAHLQKRYLTPGEECVLPYLRNTIMSGSLCCVTEFGQERVVRLFQGLLFDLCD